MKNAFDLTGKRALITGGGSGIGLGIARTFADAGAELVLVGRREEVLRKAQEELGSCCEYRVQDVSDLEALPAFAQEVGKVDIFVHCAGAHLKKTALEVSDAEFARILNIHVCSAFALCREFAKGMKERGGGAILLISSMTAVMGMKQVVAYTTAKSAILGLQRALVADLSIDGIRVNTIAPGWIETPMLHQAIDADAPRRAKILDRIPTRRFGDPEDIGNAALFLCSPAGKYVNGVFLPVDAGAAEAF